MLKTFGEGSRHKSLTDVAVIVNIVLSRHQSEACNYKFGEKEIFHENYFGWVFSRMDAMYIIQVFNHVINADYAVSMTEKLPDVLLLYISQWMGTGQPAT